jgi:acetylornithine deacetylase/succinyl-diaminopimelate desuccinylase-like protein
MKRIAAALSLLAALSLNDTLLFEARAQVNEVRAYRQSREAEIIDELFEFLSIPNVASDSANIRRNAEMLQEMMRRRGIDTRLLESKGSPAVFGELKAPGASLTIGFYAHYDGQPVDATKWASEPFKPVLRERALEAGGRVIELPPRGKAFDPEWRIYARSASDDKSPIVAMLVALDALKAAGKRPSVNLKFLFDGEEEAGSPNLKEIAERNKSLLAADAWICADGPVHQTRKPLVYFGARGIVTADITVYGANRALHSGHYGNWSPNPAMMLARLLAGMKDESGRVLIEGFYDDVVPLATMEKRALADAPDTDSELMRELGLSGAEGGGRKLVELINEPSLNIDGIRSEYVGREARTIIPAEATATLDLRLVKGVDPRRQVDRLVAHIKKQGYFVTDKEPDSEMRLKHPKIARVAMREGAGYRAVRTSMELAVSQKVIRAAERAAGEKIVLLPTLGGSVPLWILEDATGAPQIGVPMVNHDNNQHSSNENLRIENLWYGIELYAALMTMN